MGLVLKNKTTKNKFERSTHEGATYFISGSNMESLIPGLHGSTQFFLYLNVGEQKININLIIVVAVGMVEG